MKVQIAINNDRKTKMAVQVQDLDQPVSWEHRTVTLDPATLQLISINIPDGHVPYFKIWENNTAFLSSVDPAILSEEVKS